MQSDFSHTLPGLFWFDLPLGLLLAFVFHNIVRNSLLENLPGFLKSRFSDFREFDWNRNFAKHWLVISISTLIGATSHIFWDNFTHDHGYFVETIPALTNTVKVLGGEVPILKILQHGSSLLGAFVIAFTIYKMPTQMQDTTSQSLKYWLIIASLTSLIIAIRLATGLELKQYGNAVVTAISAGLIALTLTPLLFCRKKLA
jgi:hypothetical protein